MTAAETRYPSYAVLCRHCGETIAIRTTDGSLRVLDKFKPDRGSRLNVTCPECKRMTRVTANLGVSDYRT